MISSACLVSCQYFDSHAIELSLSSSNSLDDKYENTLIKVCGLATKQFENVQITEHRDDGFRDTARGFGVEWMDKEPNTDEPEYRCITGFVRPICGWEDFGNKDLICASTGHGYDWVIVQTFRSRN